MKRGETQPTLRGKNRHSSPALNQPTPAFWKSSSFQAGLLFVFTALLYLPSYTAGYLWDDEILVRNELVSAGWPGLRDIWTTTRFPDFVPLTATSFWLEWQLGGGTPLVEHTTNIVLQGLNVVLLWLVLRQLRIRGAFIAALIFAAHPLCVTSVTWVAERKNTLSMLFYLLTLWFFLRSTQTTENGSPTAARPKTLYWLSFAFSLCALLSKTSTVVLPVTLLLCAAWQNGGISRSVIRSTLPFFGFAFAAGVTILIAHYIFGAKGLAADKPVVRLLGGGKAVWFYLAKTYAPFDLTMNYPRWEMNVSSVLSYLPVAGLMALFALCWCFRQSWGRACLFGLGYFVIALAPTLGVFKMTFLIFAQVADHFAFLALPGLIALTVGGILHLAQDHSATVQKVVLALLLLVIMPLLAWQSWQHQLEVHNAETMWSDNLKKNPGSWLARYGLATKLEPLGQIQAAEKLYREAIALRPNYLAALSNLGGLLGRLNRWDEALIFYQRALAVDPTSSKLNFNLGTAYLSRNQFAEAAAALAKAAEINPKDSTAQNNLASALMKLGKREESVAHARKAVELNPANDEAQTNLGLLLFQSGKSHEAANQFQKALSINSTNVSAHCRFAMLLSTEGKTREAFEHLSKVEQLQPDNLLAQTGLADILARGGKIDQATPHQAALQFLRGRDSLNKGQLAEAKESFQQGLKINGDAMVEFAGRVSQPTTPNALAHLDLLASICAEEKQTTNAIKTLERIVQLAEMSRQQGVLQKYRDFLEQYRRATIPP